jgi:hypothetical protein
MISKYTLERCNSLPKFDRSVSLLCWAYNEEQLIGDYLIRANEILNKTVEDYEIVVIDDCSTDRTNEIITTLNNKIPQIKLIRNSANLNVGLSSQKAIMNATKEYLFWQTIDNIAVVKPVLGLMKLFGIKHITRRSDTIPKAIISVINYVLIRTLFNVPLSDYQNVVFYPTRLIQSLVFESKSSFSNPEALFKCFWKGCSIAEVPISFIPRQTGAAKGTRPKAIQSSVLDIFRLWFKWTVLGQREMAGKGNIKRLNPDEWGLL